MSVGLELLLGLAKNKASVTWMADFNLEDSDFVDEERKVLRFVNRHIRKFGKPPSANTLVSKLDVEFPDYSDESLEYMAEQVKLRTFTVNIRETVNEAFDHLREGRLQEASELFVNFSAKIANYDEGKIYAFAELIEEVLTLHDERQQHLTDESVIPLGFPALDEISGGVQKGETTALVGDTGIGKTFAMCAMANTAFESGCNVLICSMEMAAIQLARRISAIRARVSETKVRRGELDTLLGRKRVLKDILTVKRKDNIMNIIDGSFVLTVDKLEAICRTLRPDILFVDGAYLLKSKSSIKDKWIGISDVHERLKLFTLELDMHTFGTYQLHEGNKTYGGRSIDHLAGLVLHLLRDEGFGEGDGSTWRAQQTRILNVKKGRFGEFGRIRISYDMFTSTIREIERLPLVQQERRRRRRND